MRIIACALALLVVSGVNVTGAGRDNDDPVTAKLREAKGVYENDVARLKTEFLSDLDKAEDAARGGESTTSRGVEGRSKGVSGERSRARSPRRCDL